MFNKLIFAATMFNLGAIAWRYNVPGPMEYFGVLFALVGMFLVSLAAVNFLIEEANDL